MKYHEIKNMKRAPIISYQNTTETIPSIKP